MRSSNILRRVGLVALATLLAAGPLAAYTIYLKDGSTVQAKSKYRIEGNRAVIVLPNGTQTFIDARQIDVKRTEAANKSEYGGTTEILSEKSPQEPAPQTPQQRRLSDVIASRGSELPGPQREAVRATPRDSVRTPAGHTDFSSLPRRAYEPAEVSAEIRQFFLGQGVSEVTVYNGTQPSHPLVQVTVGSENEVFRGLAVGANAILHIRDRFPGKVEAFDLLLVTAAGERGGQFVLTPQMATDLVAKKVQLAAFFVENVQF
jgi:hypothetical protein